MRLYIYILFSNYLKFWRPLWPMAQTWVKFPLIIQSLFKTKQNIFIQYLYLRYYRKKIYMNNDIWPHV